MTKIDRLCSCLKQADYQLEHYDSLLLPETESAVERWRQPEGAEEDRAVGEGRGRTERRLSNKNRA